MRGLFILIAGMPFALGQGLPAGTEQPFASQVTAANTQDAKPAEAKPDSKQDAKADAGQSTKPSDAAQAADAAAASTPASSSPVPAPEMTFNGWVEAGERWLSGVGGSFDAYRSLVNLGSGPKLLGTEVTVADPGHRLFDTVRFRAYNWGDDPYSTLHLDAQKSKLYEFAADYRDIAYFDFLPSYADPLLARGITLNEQAFDTRRRFAHLELNLLPGNRISPFVAYDWDSGNGTGVTAFITTGNQYPVPTTLHDGTANLRAGARFQFRSIHLTLEQGGTWYRDAQTIYQSGGVNYGNSLSPVFGQTLNLTDLLAAYGGHGTGIYTKALATATPFSWLDFYGQFMYSQPNTDVNYQQYNGGNLYQQNPILFYTAQEYLVSSTAQMPHTTGSAGVEIRPIRKVRITESWLTDRMHNAASAAQNNSILAPPSAAQEISTLLYGSLANDYNQVEALLFFDATSQLTLRGGYRYVWGDGNDLTLPPAGLAYSDLVHMRRNVGIGGFTYRPLKKLSLSAEGEGGWSGGEYFRTSLWDYQRVRAQARYQANASLSLSADFSLLGNQNPQSGINLDYLALQESLSVFWSPAGGKTFDFQGTYSRASLRSDIDYLDPGTLQQEISAYRDNSHTVTSLFHLHPHVSGAVTPQITLGGSFFISSGSRPTSYYQPIVKISVPVDKHFTWFAEWQYYGYGEAFYLYEGFRANLVTTGLRYTR